MCASASPHQVDVADTVGCGDSFASAIVLGMLRKAQPATALALANAVGAATAMGTGAGRNVARATKVAEILLGLQVRKRVNESAAMSVC